MKYGVNRVTLVGNVGEVPRVTERDGEAFVANFPLATDEYYRNKEGEEVSKTEWHRVVVWNKAADIVKRHVNKGDALYVEGEFFHKLLGCRGKETNTIARKSYMIVSFLSPRNNRECSRDLKEKSKTKKKGH